MVRLACTVRGCAAPLLAQGRTPPFPERRAPRLPAHIRDAARGTQRHGRRADDRVLLTTDRDRLRLRWAPDGSRLYAVMGGDRDWRVVEIPLAPGDVRVLASGAAEIGDLAVSPDGARLVFTAAEFAYPQNRRALYVMQPSERTVRPIALSGIEPGALTWSDADTLLVVTTAVSDDAPFTLPQARTLKNSAIMSEFPMLLIFPVRSLSPRPSRPARGNGPPPAPAPLAAAPCARRSSGSSARS